MTTTWNTRVYTQERSILTLTGFTNGAHNVVIATTSPAGYSARYIIPTSGTLAVDLSDLVRIVASGTFTVTECDEAGTALSAAVTLTWARSGRLRPTAVIIPENRYGQNPIVNGNEIGIIAPSVLLRTLNNNVPILFEMADTGSGYQFSTGRLRFKPYGGPLVHFTTEVVVPVGADIIEFWYLYDIMITSVELKDLECEKTYALVEWVSYTGRTRRHTFEVVKVTTENTERVDIETLNGQYDQRKNRLDSFTLRLEGLDRYDLWYYSDLITSSQVKVSLNGVNWYQVQVTAKKQTLPETDAGKFNVLEIPVNFRKYDTL